MKLPRDSIAVAARRPYRRCEREPDDAENGRGGLTSDAGIDASPRCCLAIMTVSRLRCDGL